MNRNTQDLIWNLAILAILQLILLLSRICHNPLRESHKKHLNKTGKLTWVSWIITGYPYLIHLRHLWRGRRQSKRSVRPTIAARIIVTINGLSQTLKLMQVITISKLPRMMITGATTTTATRNTMIESTVRIIKRMKIIAIIIFKCCYH